MTAAPAEQPKSSASSSNAVPSPGPGGFGAEAAVSPGRRIVRRYALSLAGIGLLLAAAAVVFHLQMEKAADLLEIVNLSGRQRMLSQQVTLHALRLAEAEDPANAADARASLARVLAELEGNYHRLTHEQKVDDPSGPLRHLYFGGPEALSPQFRAFVADVDDLLQTPPQGGADARVQAIIERGQGALLDALDRAVLGYQRYGERSVFYLQILVDVALAGICVILVLEGVLVFRPMIRRSDRHLATLQAISAELARARDTLEDRVAQRTRDLAEARAAAERESEAKSRFLATVGHDLLQPVKALGIFVTALERSRHEALPLDHEPLTDLRGALTSISALLKGLLDFSRAEHGLLDVVRRPVPVAPLLEQLSAEYQPLAASQDLRLRVVPCHVMVESDPVLLERMIRNLLSNALRYTSRGGIVIGCRRRQGILRLEVHDSGPGIAADALPTIHRAFTRGPGQSLKDRGSHEALGLGLAIVAELAPLLGHGTGVDSVEGRGSVFWLDLPLVRPRTAEARAGAWASPPVG